MPGSLLGDDYQPELEDLIPLTKAAKLSGLTTGRLRQLLRKKELWGKKINRDWVTTEQAIREYLSRDIRPGRKSKS